MDRPTELPREIGRYEVESELGRGMMGVVYKAHDPLLRRTVALKVIDLAFPVSDQERERFEQRFLAEGRIVARLSHPGIVMVHDLGRDEALGLSYLALEYLVGRTLEQRLDEGMPPGWQAPLSMLAKVARALHYAHQHGVVHRDIKPANIMLLEDGEPKVMDFGVARLQAGFGLTHTGHMLGTPLYMAPEQALGEEVDGRADVFSLASVLYTLVTGRHAFAADSVPLILTRVAYEDPPPPSQLVASLPPALDRVLQRALAKPRETRYPDAAGFADDLEDVLGEREPRHLAGWEPPARAGTGTLVAGAAGTGTAVAPATRPAPPPTPDPPAPAPPSAEPPPAAAATAPAPVEAPRRRRRGRLPLLLASLLGLTAALGLSDFWRPRVRQLLGSDEARRVRERVAGWLGGAARAAGSRGREALDDAVTAIRDPTPAPGPEPSPPPVDPGTLVSEAQVELAVPEGMSPARLSVSLPHPAGAGRLRLWVDAGMAFEGNLAVTAGEPALVFRDARGARRGVLPLAPGQRELSAELVREGTSARATLPGAFAAGQSRHLEIAVAADGSLALAWR